MNYNLIKFAILAVFNDCNVKSFPINCFDILKNYNLIAHSYESLPTELQEYCIKYSEDAFTFKDKICYNSNLPYGRIRFSLMHELGHVILKHSQVKTLELEQEANFFASNILAPRMAIHYAGCKNESDVSKLFDITNEAAQYAFDDYKRWHKWITIHKMSAIDKAMYSYFYNENAKRFVYSQRKCAYCDADIYNSTYFVCNKCIPQDHSYTRYEPQEKALLIAENYWLYAGL